MVNKSANISSGNNRSRSRCKNRNTEPSGNDSSQNRVTSSRRSPCRCTNPRLIGLSRTRVTPMRFSPITTANASTQARERHQSPRLLFVTERLYFRQLLAGRDLAPQDPVARQMVNFVYLIGDRETGEAVAVVPA